MRQPWRLGERGERWLDRLLVGFLAFPVVAGVPLGGFEVELALLMLAQILPLWWRRTHPVAVAVAVALAHLAQLPLTDLPLWGQVAAPIAIYSTARFSTARWGIAALAAGIVGAVLGPVDWLSPYSVSGSGMTSYFLTIAAIVCASWALGTMGRTRAAYVGSLIERGERLEREAEQQALLAAQDERARIAREMHDVVAHGLSVIVVQADGARYAAAKDPAVATDALATIAETGRDALTEMRRMLGLLRSEESGTAPQPGLADLAHLVAEARAGAMELDAELPYPLPPASDGVGLTAYRIVQEALTNIRKHAGPGARATLRVVDEGTALRIEVDDDGRGAASTSDGNGLGLVGMRERIAVHGGTLDAGPRPGGGFSVSARLPR
ncbi:sensor histidine kinase [Nocardioides sp. AE5]|uniref:sensor histidine kinase n=1 Tax=Nocardioides sp. AE5 TaxID=2962573 RepID=UPI002881A1E6|nr:sensor histidine kinase [Nocardioides sp. AE5]MDT0200523.1 sensor histidine kinase [Nocardioides sp. AE5]